MISVIFFLQVYLNHSFAGFEYYHHLQAVVLLHTIIIGESGYQKELQIEESSLVSELRIFKC